MARLFTLSVIAIAATLWGAAAPGDAPVLPHPRVRWEQFSPYAQPMDVGYFEMHGPVSRMVEKDYYGGPVEAEMRHSSTTEYEFNDSGFVLEQQVTYGILMASREVNAYENETRWLTKKSYNRYSNDKCTDSLVCTYDKQGRLAAQAKYFPHNQQWILLSTTHFQYDARGWLGAEIELKSDGDTLQWRWLEYDERGNQVKEVRKHPEAPMPGLSNYTSWTTFDMKGRPLQDSSLSITGDCGILRYEYNDQGFAASHSYSSTGPRGPYRNLSTYTYKYDTAGNWVERKEYKNGQLYSKREREISYR